MTMTLGVDVSSHQDPSGSADTSLIDWARVASSPFGDFALARMSIGRGTRDEDGRQNLRAMLDTIPVAGAYGVVGTSEPVEDGAKLLLDEIAAAGADPRQILVMLDAENFGKRPDGTVPHPTIGQVDRYAIQLHAELGRWPVAYVPDWWLQGHGYSVAGRALANCPWAPSEYFPAPWTEARLLARKPTSLLGFGSLAWLQFTSSGTVPGITGRVDLNCYYGTLSQLRAQLLGQEDDMTIEELERALSTPNSVVRNKLRELALLGSQDTLRTAVAGGKDKAAGPYFAGLANDVAGLKATLEAGIKVSLDVSQLTPDQLELIGSVFAGRAVITGIRAASDGTFTVNFAPAA